MNMKKIKPKHYTISKLEQISRTKKIICFGCGNNLTYIFGAMKDLQIEDRINYIVDNDSAKWNTDRFLNGKKIIIKNPENLKTENWTANILLIAIVEYRVILDQLEELLEGTEAVCLVSPAYRYWYDRIIEQITLKQSIRKAVVLQGKGTLAKMRKR